MGCGSFGPGENELVQRTDMGLDTFTAAFVTVLTAGIVHLRAVDYTDFSNFPVYRDRSRLALAGVGFMFWHKEVEKVTDYKDFIHGFLSGLVREHRSNRNK